MNNWEKIIEGYSKKPDNQTMKLITATVTSVTNDFYRADVRLITGQEISNLINQTPNKLHVGQNVEVGYRTTPEAGWIQIAHGEPDPMRQGGGGVQVENAVILNDNNMADWEVNEELMLDISAHDKLYYGGHQKMVVVQGHACRYANSALDDTDALKFGTKLELDGWYREAAADTYVQRHYVIEMYVNDIRTSTSGGVTSDRYVFGFTVSRYVPNASTPEDVRAFYTSNVVNPSDAFIVLSVSAMSFVTEFTKTWSSTTQTVSTPYGYVQCNNLTIAIGVLTEASPTAITYPTIFTNSGSSTPAVYLNQTGSAGNDQYRCVPLGGNAEKYFDMALTKRSEPTGGGNS